MDWNFGEYKVSTDKTRLSLDKICEMLGKSYWAAKRPRAVIEKSLANSVCFGVYHQGQQVGFARVVSDFSVMYWLCDVIIAEEYRGHGLGKHLVECIIEEFSGLVGILATKDAHELYKKYGFIEAPAAKFMAKIPQMQG
jgi:GNAT superfamily N-acetyltransferase